VPSACVAASAVVAPDSLAGASATAEVDRGAAVEAALGDELVLAIAPSSVEAGAAGLLVGPVGTAVSDAKGPPKDAVADDAGESAAEAAATAAFGPAEDLVAAAPGSAEDGAGAAPGRAEDPVAAATPGPAVVAVAVGEDVVEGTGTATPTDEAAEREAGRAPAARVVSDLAAGFEVSPDVGTSAGPPVSGVGIAEAAAVIAPAVSVAPTAAAGLPARVVAGDGDGDEDEDDACAGPGSGVDACAWPWLRVEPGAGSGVDACAGPWPDVEPGAGSGVEISEGRAPIPPPPAPTPLGLAKSSLSRVA
jgi:hypothetical protein